MRGGGRRRSRYNIPEDAPKLKMRRIYSNNLYMLKIIHKIDPFMIPLRLLLSVFSAVTGFLSSAYLLRYALNAVGEGKQFSDVLVLVIAFVVAELFVDLTRNAFWYLYHDRRYYDISKKVNADIFKKANG